MKVRNVNPLGEVVNLDVREEPIGRGEVVEVDEALGARLLEQAENWAPVSKDAKAERAEQVAAAEKAPEAEAADPVV